MLQAVVCLLICALLGFSLPGQNTSQQRQAKPAPKERSESGKKASRDNPQEDNKISPDKELTSNQRQALDILNLLFNDAKEITDPQTRIKVQAQVADALWPYDAAKARQQFENTFREIDSFEKPQDSSASARIATDKPASEIMTAVKDQLRRYVIRVLSHRDAKFADALIRSQKVSAESGEGKSGEGEF